MAIWLIRAGKHGEFEQKFLDEGRVYITWDGLSVDISAMTEKSELTDAMKDHYPEAKLNTIINWVGQLWPFAHEIKKSDLIVQPLKNERSIRFGEVAGDYHFEPDGPDPYFHWRPVAWNDEPVPRSHFGKDLLFSFGASQTICRIQRNNAEARLSTMRASGWGPEKISSVTTTAPAKNSDSEGSLEAEIDTDLEEMARDKIAQLISARFKGHGLTRLVDGILRAQGYVTYRSPEGADGGADILAGAGPLGFGSPRLCVEVKSESSPIGRPTVDKLLGAVGKFGAQEGLFVSWSGFKPNVQKELAPSFFRVRLWSQNDLLEALFVNYDRLDDDLKAELPLKRIWTVTKQDDE